MGRKRQTDKHLPQGVYWHHGAYWFRYYQGGKKCARRLAEGYPEALAQLSLILSGTAPELTVAALISRYELEELPKKAVTSQRNERYRLPVLVKVFGEMRPEDIEPHDVWRYWKDRGEGGAARHEIRLLSAILTFGRRIGALSKPNPCYGLKLPGEKPRERYVTDEEFTAVRALAPPMVGYAMDLALICGMDRSTILALERRNITDQGIEFRRGKTDEWQVIAWNPDLRYVIDSLMREPPRLRAALICNREGKRYTADGFKTFWHRTMEAATAAGIERFHFHDLRAKSASEADSDQIAADRLGHQSSALTRRVYRRLPRVAQPGRLPERK